MSNLRLHVLVAIAAGAVTLVLSASCGSTRSDCSPASCTGCCDQNDECQPGYLNQACGVGGAACIACEGVSSCGGGLCLTGSSGRPDGGICRNPGAACSAGAQCCSGQCDGTVCLGEEPDAGPCNGLGGACFAHSECCSNNCVSGRCAKAEPPKDGGTCSAEGETCTANTQCCSKNCAGGTCGPVTPGDGGVPDCDNISGDRQTQVCLRWECDRADRDEGLWGGSVASCTPADNLVNRANAVKIVNLYRFLAGLPEVTHDAIRNGKAQQCALMMHANGKLDHYPPDTWTCWTQDGAEAASKSDIATAPGVSAVDLYMVDSGANNAGTLGHRRWILSPGLGPVGSGSTSQYSCLWVVGGTGTATRPFVAWPPPGPFPMGAYAPGGGAGSVNTTGWSIQSDTLNLSSAAVTVIDNGNSLPVTVFQLGGGYGSTYAIRFVPQGWSPQAGHTYDVTVTGTVAPISYSVQFVSCP